MPEGSATSAGVAMVTVGTMLATMMQALDTTIANVALPYMSGTFASSYDESTWVLTSYIVAAAIMTPPTVGPSISPISADVATPAIAATSSERGVVRSITSRPIGTITAPPIPCRMRAASRNARQAVRPHRMEPMMDAKMGARTTVRVPNRPAIQPLAWMSTARLSR